MVNRLETYFVAYYVYFTAKLRQMFLKKIGQFENLVFVIVSIRENIRPIARTSLLRICTFYYKYLIYRNYLKLGNKTVLFLYVTVLTVLLGCKTQTKNIQFEHD